MTFDSLQAGDVLMSGCLVRPKASKNESDLTFYEIKFVGKRYSRGGSMQSGDDYFPAWAHVVDRRDRQAYCISVGLNGALKFYLGNSDGEIWQKSDTYNNASAGDMVKALYNYGESAYRYAN